VLYCPVCLVGGRAERTSCSNRPEVWPTPPQWAAGLFCPASRSVPAAFANSRSMISTTSGESGFVRDPKRATTSPLRLTMYFSKSQPIFPGPFGFVSRDVRNLLIEPGLTPRIIQKTPGLDTLPAECGRQERDGHAGGGMTRNGHHGTHAGTTHAGTRHSACGPPPDTRRDQNRDQTGPDGTRHSACGVRPPGAGWARGRGNDAKRSPRNARRDAARRVSDGGRGIPRGMGAEDGRAASPSATNARWRASASARQSTTRHREREKGTSRDAAF